MEYAREEEEIAEEKERAEEKKTEKKEAEAKSPPPPPPWSKYFSKNSLRVIYVLHVLPGTTMLGLRIAYIVMMSYCRNFY